MSCITQGLTTFIAPFYLQDVLKLTPTFIGIIFLIPSLFSMVLSPVSGAMTDRIGARFLLITGVVILLVAFLIGASLRARLPLDVAHQHARAYGDRIGIF